MNPPRVEQVIIAYERRGDGKNTPIRWVLQVFTLAGKLIAEAKDPVDDTKEVSNGTPMRGT